MLYSCEGDLIEERLGIPFRRFVLVKMSLASGEVI